MIYVGKWNIELGFVGFRISKNICTWPEYHGEFRPENTWRFQDPQEVDRSMVRINGLFHLRTYMGDSFGGYNPLIIQPDLAATSTENIAAKVPNRLLTSHPRRGLEQHSRLPGTAPRLVIFVLAGGVFFHPRISKSGLS